MADPLRDSDRDARIRQKAHQIWEQEGRPEGRDQAHWDMASELVAQQENIGATLQPNPSEGGDDVATRQGPIEPELAHQNLGDVPGIRDQGEERQFPSRDALRDQG